MKVMKLRIASIVLVFALFFVNAAQLTVYAAPPAESQGKTGPKTLSGLAITNFDEPSAGVPFKGNATITTSEGVSWEIPVIWTDVEGNIVTVPVSGKKYIPTFVFFLPEGYVIPGISAQGRFAVRLPSFLISLYGTDDLLFTLDPSTGVTFITCGVSQYSGISGAALWGVSPVSNTPEISTVSSLQDDGPSDSAIEPQQGNVIPEQVRIHCTEKVIQMIDTGFLAQFVDIVKHRLIPQAANLLKESFPAYRNAGEDELGKEIGLIIYNGDDEFYSSVLGCMVDLSNGAFAFNSTLVSSTGALYQIIGINTDGWIVQNPDGSFSLISEEMDLGNSLMHEMMHAFMHDYTRFGMTSIGGDEFPIWFYEGIAQTVLNNYQSNGLWFQELSDADRRGNYNPDKCLYDGEIVYSAQSLLARLNEGDTAVREIFDITQKDEYSPYVAGYLAVLYLGYLAAKEEGYEAIRNDGDCDIDVLRGGVNSILERLHDNETLDDIISSISDYNSTAEFQSRFMNGEAQEEKDMDALSFCASYLNFLEGQKIPDGDGTRLDLGNGSILTQNQQYVYILDYDTEAESSLYRVADTGDYVNTCTDILRPWETGGVSIHGLHELEDEVEESESAAAIMRPETPPALSGAEPEEAIAEEPPSEEASAEDPPAEETTTGLSEATTEEPPSEEASAEETTTGLSEAAAEDPPTEETTTGLSEAAAEEPPAEETTTGLSEATTEEPPAEETTTGLSEATTEEPPAEETAAGTEPEECVPTEEAGVVNVSVAEEAPVAEEASP